MKVNDEGKYVSDDGKWVWDGEAWQPAVPVTVTVAEDSLLAATSMGYDETEDAPTPTGSSLTTTCYEQDCQLPPLDFVRLALQAPMGSMTVEVLLCQMHIANLEMMNNGTYLYIRPRERLDLNGR